ncbi:ethylmalonyl-CoA decarboxylase-like [Saccostrea echinata]|uniref:ethylmalonyl-CoA decarboxylase-like n=1 Tax=Saccostrea echinata TaxID=191078 RepID=UPI002A81CBA9|nr:ethylmalonyl-CoA decarboxylase-like [Saccostrea echinata]
MLLKTLRQLCVWSRPAFCTRSYSGGSTIFTGSGQVMLQQNDTSGIAVVTLDNPGKKNALSGSMMVQLEEIVKRLEKWDTGKAVIVTGKGHDFCTGGDLEFVRNNLNRESGHTMCTHMQGTLTKLKNLPLISVALICGMAVGGGAELCTACDFRLVTEGARIGFVQLKMGVVTGFGGGTRLTKIIGRSEAIKVLCSGKVLKAEECRKIGLVDDILSNTNEPFANAVEWIQNNFPHERSLTRKMKEIIVGATELDSQSSLVNEKEIFVPTWSSPLHVSAVNSNIKHKE